MKKYRVFTLLLAIVLLIPTIFTVSKVFAANPSFTIGEVVSDQTVTILVKDAPKNREFIVRMGEYDTKAINGIESGRFQTGNGGNLQATIDIPAALKGRAQIAIRMDSVTGGWYYYNWFWNKKEGGTWPPPSTTPQPTTPPAATPQPTKTATKIVPTITIKSAVESQNVTIVITNFPKNAEMKAFMGEMYTRGKDGIEVGTFTTTDAPGTEVTLNIPAELANDERVAIRVESVRGGWYSYNWFWNKQGGRVVTPPSTSPVTTPAPTQVNPQVKYPSITIVSIDSGKTVSIKAENLSTETEFTVLMGKMWTRGVNGVPSAIFNTGTSSTAELTVDIPASLANESLIAIRIQGTNGSYAYNWFKNK
jgi:hypothetical protein